MTPLSRARLLHLVHQVAEKARLGVEAQLLLGGGLQIVARGQQAADGGGGLVHAIDTGLGVGGQVLPVQSVGKRQHALKLGANLFCHAIEEELGEGHG